MRMHVRMHMRMRMRMRMRAHACVRESAWPTAITR